MATASTKLVTASFTVAARDLDAQFALGICRLLQVVTEQTDAMIIRVTGSLDYNSVHPTHYHLDVVGTAKLGDTVLIHTFVRSEGDQALALELRAVRRRGRKEEPLLNGSFVYRTRREAQVAHPHS